MLSVTHKPSEHNEDQKHLRAERRQDAISSGPGVMEHTHAQGMLKMCRGLSKLRYDGRDGGENQFVRTVTIPVKREYLRRAGSKVR